MGEELDVLATDASEAALELARENAVGHSVADRVRFVAADLLPPVVGEPFDIVLANLPYIPSPIVPTLPVAASFEPVAALDGGPDGLDVIRRLLGRLPEALADGGVALLEIGADQSAAIEEAVHALLAGSSVFIHPDLSGAPRVARVALGR